MLGSFLLYVFIFSYKSVCAKVGSDGFKSISDMCGGMIDFKDITSA